MIKFIGFKKHTFSDEDMELKCDLHLHTNEDPKDKFITHSPQELIAHASKLGFNVLAITLHEKNCYKKELANYARKKGILLIPGCEANIEGKHVLLYNFTDDELKQIKTIQDIKKYKRKDNLVIAPHPYYFTKSCLREKLDSNIEAFDVIEYCHFYHKFFSFNKKAVDIAEKHNKPIIGTSDTHRLWQMGHTYSIIDAKDKNVKDIIQAIKQNKVQLRTKPLKTTIILQTIISLMLKE